MIDAIASTFQTGTQWVHLPEKYGRQRGVCNRLRMWALDGTDHVGHKDQGGMIRRYIVWRNKHAQDERLRKAVNRASVA